MFQFIKNISLLTFLLANTKKILKVFFLIILFVIIELIIGKWLNTELGLSESIKFSILMIYSFMQITVCSYIFFILGKFSWGLRAKKIVQSKTSVNTMSEELLDIEDIDKFPNLKEESVK